MGCKQIVTLCLAALLAALGCDNSQMDAGAWKYALAGVKEDVPVEEAAPVTVAQFDPAPTSPDMDHLLLPAVPTPSDLLIVQGQDGLPQVNLPLELTLKVKGVDEPVVVPAFSTPAALQFVGSYLNTLSGFVLGAPLSSSFKGAAIDVETVTDESIYVLDVTAVASGGGIEKAEGYQVIIGARDEATGQTALSIMPPPQGWTAGHQYLAVVETSVKDVDGDAVASSYVYNLLKSTEPLAVNGLSVAALPDATAVELEAIRQTMAPLFDLLASDAVGPFKVTREEIAVAWTFSVRPGSVAVNDPTVSQIPTPNDLVMFSPASSLHDCDGDEAPDCTEGHLCFPIDCDNDSDAQLAFSMYMNSLDGWPASMVPQVSFSLPVDAASASAESVYLYKLGGEGATGAQSLEVKPMLDEDNGTLLTLLPATPVEAGGAYAAVVTRGLYTRAPEGEEPKFRVGPSDVTAISKLTEPVVDADGASQLLEFGVDDPSAVLLETIRQGLDSVIQAVGLDSTREDIAAIWSFHVQTHNEAMFDTIAGIIPFPNDVLMSLDEAGNPVLVNLPIDQSWPEVQKDTIAQVNKLDGFSPVTPVRTRFLLPLDTDSFFWLSDDPGPPHGLLGVASKGLDPISLAVADVTEVDLTAENPMDAMAPLMTPANVYTEGEVKAWFENGQLAVAPVGGAPLRPGRRYMVLAFDNLKTQTDGDEIPIEVAPVFFMARTEHPLVDQEGKSLLSTLSDADAAQLEMLRTNYKPIFDALASIKVNRERVLMFWTFTTQTIGTWLEELRQDLPKPDAGMTVEGGAVVPDGATELLMENAEYLVVGKFSGWSALAPPDTQGENPTAGRMEMDEKGKPVWKETMVPFILAVPDADKVGKDGPYPIVVLQHGLGQDKTGTLSQANRFLEAGYAIVATDLALHGDYETAGAPPDVLFFSADAVATRDNVVQSALNLVQLVTFVTDSGTNWIKGEVGDLLDTETIYFVGHSTGAIVGAVALAVEDRFDAAALIAGGGHLTRILMETPDEDFKAPIVEALAAMGFEEGTAEYFQFLETAQMLLDRADPLNYAAHFAARPLEGHAPTPVFMLRATADGLIPESTAMELACAARDGNDYPYFKKYENACHAFFFDPCVEGGDLDAKSVEAAQDVINFLDNAGTFVDATAKGVQTGAQLTCQNL